MRKLKAAPVIVSRLAEPQALKMNVDSRRRNTAAMYLCITVGINTHRIFCSLYKHLHRISLNKARMSSLFDVRLMLNSKVDRTNKATVGGWYPNIFYYDLDLQKTNKKIDLVKQMYVIL